MVAKEGGVKNRAYDYYQTSPVCAEHWCSFRRHGFGKLKVQPGKSHSKRGLASLDIVALTVATRGFLITRDYNNNNNNFIS